MLFLRSLEIAQGGDYEVSSGDEPRCLDPRGCLRLKGMRIWIQGVTLDASLREGRVCGVVRGHRIRNSGGRLQGKAWVKREGGRKRGMELLGQREGSMSKALQGPPASTASVQGHSLCHHQGQRHLRVHSVSDPERILPENAEH